jgi:predicted GNAT family N-acyltransferase
MKIKYKKVHTINEFIDAIRLRVGVFIQEQGFKPGWEPDEDDKISKHFIAICDEKIVSTARYRETSKGEIKIERMVTLKSYRHKNIGKGLVEFILKDIKKLKPKRIWLRSQVQSQPFYEKCGFAAFSKPFEIWNVMHVDMEYSRK